MGQVLFLALLQLTGGGVNLGAGLRPASACAAGLPVGLVLWLFAAAVASSAGIPWSAGLTLLPAVLGGAAGLALAVRAQRLAPLAISTAAVAGLAALVVWAESAIATPLGHDALLAAHLDVWPGAELDPSARFLAILQRAALSLGAPLDGATGPVAAAALVVLVALGARRRRAAALLAALALLSLHAFAVGAASIDVPMTGALFLVGFAVVHAGGAEEERAGWLPIECALLAGLAVQSTASTVVAAVLVPLLFAADPRPPARIAAWLAAFSAAVAWWHIAGLQDGGPLTLAWLALLPLAGSAVWLAVRGASAWLAAAGAALLVAVTLFIAGTAPTWRPVWALLVASPSLGLLATLSLAAGLLVRPAPATARTAALAIAGVVAAHIAAPDPAALFYCLPLLLLHLGAVLAGGPPFAAPAVSPFDLRRAAAWLFAGAMLVVMLGNLGQHVRQHRLGTTGTRFADPGPTVRIDRWTDLHGWLRRTAPPGSTAIIPARLAPQVVLFRYFAGVEVTLADPPPSIPLPAALDLVFQADEFRTIHFKRTRTREWVVAFAGPGATHFVLAESPFGVLYWLPEELYLEAGGAPRP